MTGERARRFPLGLADVRERRRPATQADARTVKQTGANASGTVKRVDGAQGAGASHPVKGATPLKPAGVAPRVAAAASKAAAPAKAPGATPVAKKATPVAPAKAAATRAGSSPMIPKAVSAPKTAAVPGLTVAQKVAQNARPRVALPTIAVPPLRGRRTAVTAPLAPIAPVAPIAPITPVAPATGLTPAVLRAATQPVAALPVTNVSGAAQHSLAIAAQALTSERVRERMVERVRASGVTNARVLRALSVVPRHLFVDPGLATQAYEEAALPIGHHQTISKPSVVARMIELAANGRELSNVLEIGTGCGYQAAVLSQVARDVYSIERVKPLYERAKTNLRPLRIPNIRLHYGDGRLGLPAVAPFDAIVIAAAGLDVPQALREQLAIGGRLVAPVGDQQGQSQVLTLVERVGPAQWRESQLDRVFFVPLKSGVI